MRSPPLDALLEPLAVNVEAFAIVEISADAGIVLPAMQAIEVHHVLEGTLHLRIGDGGPVEVGVGSMLIVPPLSVQHMAATRTATPDRLSSDLYLPIRNGMVLVDATNGLPPSVRVACGTVLPDRHGSYGLLDGLTRHVAEDVSDVPVVAAAFDAMLKEASDPGEGTMALTSALMKACLVVLLRRHLQASRDVGVPPALLGHTRLARAIAAVLERPADPHNVSSMASEAGMSRSAFARDFKLALNATPMEFVTRARLANARRLLLATGHSIATIASIVGFSGRSHFSRSFRALYGVDPSAFRRAAARSGGGEAAHIAPDPRG